MFKTLTNKIIRRKNEQYMVKSMKSGKSMIIVNLGKMQKSPKNGGGLRFFVKW